MFFQNEAQRELFSKLKEILSNYYGKRNLIINKDKEGKEDASFKVVRGSAAVQVFPYSYRKTDTMVTLLTIVTYQNPYSSKLADWIVRLNPKIIFGGFGFVEYKEKPGFGNVVLYYDMLGKTITSDELCSAVDNSCTLADKWDNYIVENFGGLTDEMSSKQYREEKKADPGPEEVWE